MLAWRVEPARGDTDNTRAAQILPSIMPDGLHPNAHGMLALAQCLAPIVDESYDS